MGLDNIPRNYPCKTGGTAVMVNMKDHQTGEDYINENGEPELQIDCDATQECGGCPWKNKVAGEGAVYGILGTSCWYRGKYGAVLLDAAGIDANPLWGDGDGEVTPDVCRGIADEMREYAENYAEVEADGEKRITIRDPYDGEDADVTDQFFYLIRWLEWVAEDCDGAVAWY